jgi:hypothetical protein
MAGCESSGRFATALKLSYQSLPLLLGQLLERRATLIHAPTLSHLRYPRIAGDCAARTLDGDSVLNVNFIVVGVGAEKTNVNGLVSVVDADNQAVLVAAHVEHDAVCCNDFLRCVANARDPWCTIVAGSGSDP